MKKFSIIISILRNNIFSSIIIILQIFIILFNIIPNLNIFQKNINIINLAENSSFKNALYFMNDELIEYINPDTGKLISSDLENIKKNKERVRDLSLESDIVKSISPDRIAEGYYHNNITASYYIYDDASMETAKEFLISGNLPNTNSKDEIEILLFDNKFGKNYKVNDKILLESEYGKLYAKVVGKLSYSKTSFISTSVVTNGITPISNLFDKIRTADENNTVVFITDDNPIISNIMAPESSDTFQSQLIIYFKDDATDDQIKEFTKKIDEEKLGFYNITKDMIKEQKKTFDHLVKMKLEYYIMLIIVNIIALFSISFFIQRKLRKELRIYLINGASKLDILFIFVSFFVIIYLSAIGIYKFFVILGKNNIIFKSIIFTDVFYNYDISLFNFSIMTAIYILISVIVSFLPIMLLDKNKYIEDLKDK